MEISHLLIIQSMNDIDAGIDWDASMGRRLFIKFNSRLGHTKSNSLRRKIEKLSCSNI